MRACTIVAGILALLAVGCARGGSSTVRQARLSTPCTNDATSQAAIRTNELNLTAVPISTQLALIGSVTPVPFLLPDDEATCRIRKVLLAPDDLPGGWTISSFSPAPEYGGDRIYPDRLGMCGVSYTHLVGGLRLLFEKEKGVASTLAADSPNQPIPELLDDTVLVFEHGSAIEVMSAIRKSCRITPVSPSEGGPAATAHAFHGIAFSTIGDETIAFRFTVPNFPDQVEVLIRRGDVVEDISLAGAGAAAPELDRIAKIADAKITAQGSYLETIETGNVTLMSTLEPESRQAILTSALLTPDELPRGWIPGHKSAEFDTRKLGFCTDAPVLPRRERGASASYDGPAAGRGVSIDIGVMSFAPQDADSLMHRLTDGSAFPNGCSGSVQDIDVTWTVKPLAVPALGEASAAWEAVARHTAASSPPELPLISDVQLDIEVFRRGNLVALRVESRAAPRFGEPSTIFDDELMSDFLAFATAVDSKLREVQDKLPPG